MSSSRFFPILTILTTGITSFFLGGLCVYSFIGPQDTSLTVALHPIEVTDEAVDRRVFASSRGTRYYPWWCESGSQISLSNRIWFTTSKEAEKQGYSIAKACQ